MSKLLALRLKDFYQVENVSHAKLTQELSMMVRLVHQTFVLKDKRFFQMEHVRIVLNILGLPVIIRVAPHKFVLQDRFSKLMEDVLNVIHTQEQMLQERFVFHTTAMTDKN